MKNIGVKFGVLHAPGKAEVHEGLLPPLGPEEILLKMEVCNICTEDYQRWLGLREFKSPMADGHEYVGRIVQKGENVKEFWKIGDRVGKLNQQCGLCNDCRIGNTGICQFATHKAIGLENYYGMKGFATYKILPQRLAIEVSEHIPANQAAFLEPLATVIHGMNRLRLRPGENVVVVGVGTMGLLNAQVAKLFGARVIMTDVSPRKIERALSLNIGEVIDVRAVDSEKVIFNMTGGYGADAVVLAVGNSIAYEQGLSYLKKADGRLLFFSAGYPEPELSLTPNIIHYRKLELIGTVNANNSDFFDASKILSNRLIDVTQSLEGKTFPLDQFAAALEVASIPDSYRVSVDLTESNA